MVVPQLWNFMQHGRKVQVVSNAARSGLFPPSFPSALVDAAFTTGDEAAWPSTLTAASVEWFAAHGYAVLGTELWLLQSGAIQSLPMGLSGMREVHANTVTRQKEEAWNSFVARAAAETLAYLQLFKPSDIIEQGEVYFNVAWASEADYEKLTAA